MPTSTLFPMLNGNYPPFIDQKMVHIALDALLYTTSVTPNPLESLLLVDELLTDPDFPLTSHARAVALNQILATIISEELNEQHRIKKLSSLKDHPSVEDALTALTHAARTDDPELISWNLLYYRYIQADLNLGQKNILEAIPVDERTLRRYQNHAVRRLTERLIHLEALARARQRKRRLLASLPSTTTLPLIGRQEVLARVRQLNEHGLPQHFWVSGAPGIGKTAFVQEIIHRQIEEEQIDQLIWLHQPVSADFVRYILSETLVPDNSRISVRECLLLYRVSVVMDGIEILQSDLAALESLLEYLTPAQVFMTSLRYVPLRRPVSHITLGELTFPEVFELTQAAVKYDSRLNWSEDEAAVVWDKVGGNPLAAILVARSMSEGAVSSNEAINLERLYDHLYAALSPTLQRAWVAFAMLSNDVTDPPPWFITTSDITQLSDVHILEGETHLQLTAAARTYIRENVSSSRVIRRYLNEIVDLLHQQLTHTTSNLLGLVEQLLLADWVDIPDSYRQIWIESLWFQGIHEGHIASWCQILERCPKRSSQLQLAYGICLRRLSEWDLAQKVFEDVLYSTGQIGNFLQQARVLIELGILYRSRGYYHQAMTMFRKAEATLVRHKDDNLKQALRLEQAQVAVDHGDPKTAQFYLAALDPRLGRVLALESEVALLKGEFGRCQTLAQEVLSSLGSDRVAQASIHTIMGRSYVQQADFESAHKHFAAALTLLEPLGNTSALARVWSNLGAVSIHLKEYDNAQTLLVRAEEIQLLLGDQVALATTHHNLNYLKTHVVP